MVYLVCAVLIVLTTILTVKGVSVVYFWITE